MTSAPHLNDADGAALAAARRTIEESLRALRELTPCILDMSAREATLAAAYGHTLDDKKELYRLARGFGLCDFGLPNFFDFPSVSDQFLDYIVAEDLDRDQFLVTLAVEPCEPDGPLPDHRALRRLHEAELTNVILLVEIRPSTLARVGRAQDQALGDIDRYITYFRDLFGPESARRGRIYVRIADAFDAFDEDPDFVARLFKYLGRTPTTGILFEDVRGSRFTFETHQLVKLMRHFNARPRKILVHPHSGNGLEDAAAVEAILAGADGVWAGFTPHAAQGAHGSALMFLTNLVRAGNPHVAEQFRLDTLSAVAERMWQIQDHHGIPPNQPVVGARAYRYVDQYFEQSDRPGDLDPAVIGRTPGYQITPAWAPTYVIGRRLTELGHGPEVCQDQDLLYTMRMLINRSQMEGRHLRFDDPEELGRLLERAQQYLASPEAPVAKRDASDVLTMRYR